MTSVELQRAEFSSGLCGCFDDCGICCYGFWCTPCLYGDNVDKLEGGGCTTPCCAYYWLGFVGSIIPFACLQGLVAGPTRKKIREMHMLKEAPCTDCCVHYWCTSCAVCQEAREIKRKGTKPSAQFNSPTAFVAPSTQAMGMPAGYPPKAY